ncbi:MAG TPA: transcriptional regulator, partial [Desulfobacter sp.]|nr:transcriptional regulator [Desulfobacter sp.]
TEQVTEQVIKFLKHLEELPLGTREAMKRLELNHRPTFLYTYLQPALKLGLVEMTQPDSPRSPTQKYRLTTKGRQWI